MVSIKNCKEPCFALMADGCAVSTNKCRCFLYKPVDCKDWVKVERDGEEWIMPQEEYFAQSAE